MTEDARRQIGSTFDFFAQLPGKGAYPFALSVEGSVFWRYLPDARDDAFVILSRIESPPFFVAWSNFFEFNAEGPGWLYLRRYNGFDEIRQYLAARIRIERRLSISGIRAELARLKEEAEGSSPNPADRIGLGELFRALCRASIRFLEKRLGLEIEPLAFAAGRPIHAHGPAILAAGGKTGLHAPLN